MSRPERALQLTAKIYVIDRLKERVGGALEKIGLVVKAPLKRGGLPTQLSEMKDELAELKRSMGGSEKRQFEKMLNAWMGKDVKGTAGEESRSE